MCVQKTCGNYYFTFGIGSVFANKYVKIFGTVDSTRERMFEAFGSNWAFQYTEEEFLKVPAFKKLTPLAVID